MSEVRYLVAGDSAVCVEFGNEISPEINKKIYRELWRRFRHTVPY